MNGAYYLAEASSNGEMGRINEGLVNQLSIHLVMIRTYLPSFGEPNPDPYVYQSATYNNQSHLCH
jgi:hypothetical protein